ncbi:polysaccharide deacetylase family protein [Dechloromonas sp. XY25]|uniref:Polysaccharide deacetylase family protein n=1 Tax=Dechloromonas hankyongensis TaxID=2908002 RepID=A0ABS9K3K4_9RHOO|nr:polysaccharide deacetylase family protein [Dechloromonas hankyongensis]MCG2577754.1 polysaccharide deacetylase family protein [Dechloromonas hankyongensis]
MTTLTSLLTRAAFSGSTILTSSRLSILIFHRVLSQPDPLFPGEFDKARFDVLMSFVARTFNVITLGEAAKRLSQNNLPPRTLVITFDDGYADNAEVAFPILNKYDIPATYFVSSGFLNGGRMWNDTVIECIRHTEFDEIDLSKLGLGVCSLISTEARSKTISLILGKIKYHNLSEREDALGHLEYLTGNNILPTNLMMSSDQVSKMHRNGIEIGGHTTNHPILSKLNLKDAENEIAGDRDRLEGIIGSSIRVFAYPNGKPNHDYTVEHARLIEKMGFQCAVTTAKGAAKTGADLFQLPRHTPWGTFLPVWSARLLMNQLQARFDVASPLLSYPTN